MKLMQMTSQSRKSYFVSFMRISRMFVLKAPEEKAIEMQNHRQQAATSVIEEKCQVFPKCFALAIEVVSGSNAFLMFRHVD